MLEWRYLEEWSKTTSVGGGELAWLAVRAGLPSLGVGDQEMGWLKSCFTEKIQFSECVLVFPESKPKTFVAALVPCCRRGSPTPCRPGCSRAGRQPGTGRCALPAAAWSRGETLGLEVVGAIIPI